MLTQVYYTEDVEQFANYDYLMVFDAVLWLSRSGSPSERRKKNVPSCASTLKHEDMGLSTFPWADYFRRYENYASKWGFAPVTGTVACRANSTWSILRSTAKQSAQSKEPGMSSHEPSKVRNRSPFYPLKADWWTRCNRSRTSTWGTVRCYVCV